MSKYGLSEIRMSKYGLNEMRNIMILLYAIMIILLWRLRNEKCILVMLFILKSRVPCLLISCLDRRKEYYLYY